MFVFRESLFLAAFLTSALIPSFGATPLTCTAEAANRPSIRTEGVTELVGDLYVQCRGGDPTPANQNLRQVNLQITAPSGIGITSRVLANNARGNFSEALLFIDEPSPSDQIICGSPAYPYSVPVGSSQPVLSGICAAHAGTGNGIGTYHPQAPAPNLVIGGVSWPTYRGNAYQARQFANNSLIWEGIPFDPPGDLTVRVLRFTNIRINANQLGVLPGNHAFVQFVLTVSTSGLENPISVPISNSTVTIADAQPSLGFSVIDPLNCLQEQSANGDFAADSSKPLATPGSSCDGVTTKLRFTEISFPSTFRRRNDAHPTSSTPPAPIRQDTMGVFYQTESGVMKAAANGNRWPSLAANGSLIAGNTAGSLGLADHGTRLVANFTNVQNGVQLWVETAPSITSLSRSSPYTSGFARLVASPEGAFQAVASGSSQLGGIAQVPIAAGAGQAVWEVIETDTTEFERMDSRVVVAYVSNPSANLPALGTLLAGAMFAPASAAPAASSAPIPRFAGEPNARTLLSIYPFLPAPATPSPASGATGVSTNTSLSWTQTGSVDSYSIYFGSVNPPPFAGTSPTTSYTPIGLQGNTTYYWRVDVHRGLQIASSPVWSFTTGVSASGLHFVPISPCRLVDTREGNLGAFGTPALANGVPRSFVVPQHPGCNIPANAVAYSINATVVPKGYLGYLTLWATGEQQPYVSTLNSYDGRIKANAAIVNAGTGGAISAFASESTELVIDINGYFVNSAAVPGTGLAFYPLPPCRILDTRNENGSLGGPVLSGGVAREFPFLASNCGIPAGAQAYSLNATAVPTTPLGYLTLWPAGQPQPFVSTLNANHGGIVANAAIIKAGVNGAVAAFVSNSSHLVVDINGYFAPSGAFNENRYYTVPPCRVLDTRNPTGALGGPILTGGVARLFPANLSACGLPASAGGYLFNATVVPVGGLGYLTLWSCGESQPFVSTLNAHDGVVASNMAIVPGGPCPGTQSFGTNNTHLILDTSGYFAP